MLTIQSNRNKEASYRNNFNVYVYKTSPSGKEGLNTKDLKKIDWGKEGTRCVWISLQSLYCMKFRKKMIEALIAV